MVDPRDPRDPPGRVETASPASPPDAIRARPVGVGDDDAQLQTHALDKVAAARIWLTRERPLFGVLARSLRAVVNVALTAPLAITPDDQLLVQPVDVLRTPFNALCGRIAHVVLHAALGAYARRGARPLARWNLAHDLAIDPLVRAAGLSSDYALDDAVVAALPERFEKVLAGPRSTAGGALVGEGIDAALAYLDPAIAVPTAAWIDLYFTPPNPETSDDGLRPPEKLDSSLGVTGQGAVPLPGDGAGVLDVASSEGEEGEVQPRDDGAHDDDDRGSPLPDRDTERAHDDESSRQRGEARRRAGEVNWRMRLAEAIAEDQAAGSPTWSRLPRWACEWMLATVEPPPSWTAILQRAVASLAREQRSYLRPSRRSAAIGWSSDIRLAGRRVVPAGQLAAVVDTSGSIDEPTLRRALGAIAAAAAAEGLDEIRLVQADAAVTDDRIVSPTDLLLAPIAVSGRGGTDFAPALVLLAAEARRRGERGGVVYLTDLEGEFPDAKDVRALDVLWVTTGSGVAPFGKTVRFAARGR